MTVYLVLLAWVLICSPLESVHLSMNKRIVCSGKTLYLTMTFIPIWFIMAFRGLNVGTDTVANAAYFASAATAPSFSYIINDGIVNAGFNIISFVFGLLSTDREMYLLWSSTAIVLGFAFFIRRTSSKVWMSTFLFLTLNLYFMSFNASRQFIAVAIALNAFIYLYDNVHSLFGWGLFIISIWIHASAFSFLPAMLGILFVKRCHSYARIFLITTLLSIGFVFSFMVFANVFSYLFPHYAIYTEGTNGDNLIQNTAGGKIIVEYLLFAIILLIYFYYHRLAPRLKNPTIFDTMLPAAIFCVIIGIAFVSNTMMNRVAVPYQCLYLSLIPYIYMKLDKNLRLIFMIVMILGLSGYYFLWMQGNLGDIVPYTFWF